jgi:competence protein ComEC
MVRITLALILGVAIFLHAGRWQGAEHAFFLALTLAAVIRFTPLSVSWTYRWLPGLCIGCSLVLGGYAWTCNYSLTTPMDISHMDENKRISMLVQVRSDLRIKGNYGRAIVKVICLMDSTSRVSKRDLRCLAYFRCDTAVNMPVRGDRLVVHTRLSPIEGPGNPHEFDFRRYMAGRNVSVRAYLKPGDWKIAGHERNILLDAAANCKSYLQEKFRRSGLEGDDMALVSSLLLGDKDGLEQDLKDSFSAAGAMHVLCVSGLHVGILFMVFNFLFRGMGKWRHGRWLQSVLVMMIIWFYALVTGLSPSVTRASLMFSLLQAGKLMRNPPPTVNTLAASALIQVLINPLVITHVGFQLSYLAVLAIVKVTPVVQSIWQPRLKIFSWLWGLLAVSFAAQLGTGPLAIHYFNAFPSWFLLTNVIVIPLATLIIYLALALLVIPFPDVFEIMGHILSNTLGLLSGSVKMVEGLPGSVMEGIYLTTLSTFIIYLFLWMSFLLFQTRAKRYLFAILLAVIAFFALGDLKKWQAERKIIFISYQVRDHTVIDIISGSWCLSVTDCDSVPESAVAYSVSPNRIARGVSLMDTIVMGPGNRYIEDGYFYDGGFLGAAGMQLFIAGEKTVPVPDTACRVEILVITASYRGEVADLLAGFSPGHVVIDSSVPRWKAGQYLSQCDSLSIPCHAVALQGAFVYEKQLK